MKEFNWTELIENYNDDNQTFEEYFCSEMGIALEDFDELNRKFDGKVFTITPRRNDIRWKGYVDSDFRISMKGE